jgi:hypothetical protein
MQETTVSLTLFKSQFDVSTEKRLNLTSWEQLVRLLHSLSQRKLKGKRDAELVSPAIYLDGTTRANKNVLAWAGWAAVDIDDWDISTGAIEEELRKQIGKYSYVIYSTASSTIEKPKFRIVFKLSRQILNAEIRNFWFALQSSLDDKGDKQCKDLSRMYYVPGDYLNANNFFYVNEGEPVDVNALMIEYPYAAKANLNNFFERLPEELQKHVIEHRKSKLENRSYSWTSYRDCPFINKQLVRDYTAIAHVDGSGRYAMIYKIMASIAVSAVKKGYPLTTDELVDLIRELDRETSNKYQKRVLTVEADRALEYAYRNS